LYPFEWMGGVPYFYPFITAYLYEFGGVVFSRLGNVIFFLLTLVVTYKIVGFLHLKRGNLAAIVATGVLGGASLGYYVARLATYDMPSFFFLLLGVYLLLVANIKRVFPAKIYFVASISFVVSFFFKYLTGALLPLVIIFSFALVVKETKYRRRVWFYYFVVPMVLVLGVFGVTNIGNLAAFFQSNVAPTVSGNGLNILEVFITESNYVLIIWILGSFGFLIKRKWKEWLFISAATFYILFLHLILSREQTFDKHVFLAIGGMSVIAGMGLSYLDGLLSTKTRTIYKILVGATLIVFWVTSYSISAKYQFYWTNAYRLTWSISEMVEPESIVLTETGANMQLALLDITKPDNVFTFDWIYYDGVEGEEAIQKGIYDGFFDVIILESQDNPKSDVNKALHDWVVDNIIDDIYTPSFEDGDFVVYKRNY